MFHQHYSSRINVDFVFLVIFPIMFKIYNVMSEQTKNISDFNTWGKGLHTYVMSNGSK